MLVPASDHMIRAPGIEITVSAPDDVCKPGSAQRDIGLGVMDVKSVSFQVEYSRFIVKNHIRYNDMVTPRWGFRILFAARYTGRCPVLLVAHLRC